MTRRHARAALAALIVSLWACGSDRGVPENIAGGYSGGGIGGITGNGCYVNTNPNIPNDGASVVTIDAKTKFQTMQGFGASMRLFDDPRTTNTLDPVTKRGTAVPSEIDQNTLLDLLYEDGGLTRVRFLPGNGVEPVNDNGDPLVADPSKFDFTWNGGDAQIDLMPGMIRRGVDSYFSATPALETWMAESNPAEYAEWLMVSLKHWRDRGFEPPYVSLEDQPGATASGGVWSATFLRDVTKLLGARIKAEGMRTKIVLPDDVSPSEALARAQVILADADARQYVGAVAYHLGARGGELQIKQLAEQYGIPVWVTGYSTTNWLDLATTMNEAISQNGVSAFDYTWGLYGDHETSQLIRLVAANGKYSRYQRTKQYFAMSQFARYVPPGAYRVAATSADPSVKASAFVAGAKLVIVVIYTGGPFERPVRVELGTGAPCVKRAQLIRTSDVEDASLLNQMFTDIARLTTTMPAHSMVTFVGSE